MSIDGYLQGELIEHTICVNVHQAFDVHASFKIE